MNSNRNRIKSVDEFSKEIAEQMRNIFLEEYGLSVEAEARPVLKTNGVKQGITVFFEGSVIAPTVYVDDAYQQYREGKFSTMWIADRLCSSSYAAYRMMPKMPQLTEEEAKKNTTLTLVNTMRNRELLAKTPHFEILGGELSAIPRWYMDENLSFVVSSSICNNIGLTADEILEIGQHHIDSQRYNVTPLGEVLAGMMGDDYIDMMPSMECPNIMVVTSENMMQGSNVLLSESYLSKIHDLYDKDYVIIPSSVHEVLCLPIEENMNPEELRNIVRSVNAEQVAMEERLSDSIFKYDGEKLTVVGDSFTIEAPEAERVMMDGPSVKIAM